VIVQQTGKVPWSYAEDRSVDLDELARRAAARGIPPLRYPHGWPLETYSLTALRAALLADDAELLREVSAELFRTMFVEGRDLTDFETVLDAAARAGMDRDALREGIQRQDVKDRLRAGTQRALDLGVTGVPTVALDGQLFWGDDHLEDAAAAL
jgi:2-hydroxychromene-2-carboxylate isomerase